MESYSEMRTVITEGLK